MKLRILGKKLEMTQIYLDGGEIVPVTIIDCSQCVVAKVIENKQNGSTAIQLGLGISKKPSKPVAGQYKSLDTPKHIKEFPLAEDEKPAKVGSLVKVTDFEELPLVNIIAVSKGKGFSGVIKRHGFSRGPETHGSDHHRKPGSIGAMFPQRVLKGQKLPGHMGDAQITVKNSKIVSIDKTNNLLAVKGAVPGSRGNLVTIVSN
jgi:large subunit ribosomal protein L3